MLKFTNWPVINFEPISSVIIWESEYKSVLMFFCRCFETKYRFLWSKYHCRFFASCEIFKFDCMKLTFKWHISQSLLKKRLNGKYYKIKKFTSKIFSLCFYKLEHYKCYFTLLVILIYCSYFRIFKIFHKHVIYLQTLRSLVLRIRLPMTKS